jgi:hypothetical protein
MPLLSAFRSWPRLAVAPCFTALGVVAALGHALLLHVDAPLSDAIRGDDLTPTCSGRSR